MAKCRRCGKVNNRYGGTDSKLCSACKKLSKEIHDAAVLEEQERCAKICEELEKRADNMDSEGDCATSDICDLFLEAIKRIRGTWVNKT